MKSFALIFVFAALSYGQSWSGIIASSRAINWTHAGLPGTFTDKGGSNIETTSSPWTPPVRTQSGSTITPSGSAATDLSNINTALSNCTDGTYVLLGSGSFLIQGTVQMQNHSCTLRGSGPQSTIINVSGSGVFWMGAASGGGSCTLTSAGANFAAGTTTLICNSLSGAAPAVNDIIQLTQCDAGFSGNPCTGTSADDGGLFVCGFQTTCMTQPSGSGANTSQLQNFVITSVSNASGTYTLGVNTGLYMPNWAFAKTARLSWNNPTYNGIGVGIEDMTFYTNSSSVNYAIQMQNVFASWVKGVRFIGSAVTDPVAIEGGENGLFFNNYCFANIGLDGNYYGCLHTDTSSDTLILNNLLTYGNYEADGGDTGEVVAYNYSNMFFTNYTLTPLPYDHHAYDSFRLEEGNETASMYGDDTWGTHGLYTIFRNYFSCYDPTYTSYQTASQIAFSVGYYQRFHTAIGNAAGSSQCTAYSGTSASASGVIFRLTNTDALTSASFMRWGNVSTVTQSSDTPANSGIRFVSSEVPTSSVMPSSTYPNAAAWQNSVPATQSLPCSFFLPGYSSTTCTSHSGGGTGLSWWKVCTAWTTFPTSCSATRLQPFPLAGPDVSGGPYVSGYAYDTPAQIAWLNLPVDTTFQKSYTISSSSWSGGFETLTFASSVLPNATHLEGPFQTSGLNSACITGATINAANEIQMTGSTSTTVVYSLASNPGVSCTGSMKFPDVRQFDERVYLNDPSMNPPAPPILNGTVKMTGKAVVN